MTDNFRDAPGRWLATLYFGITFIVALTGRLNVLMVVLALIGLALFAPPLQRVTDRIWDFSVKGWRLFPLFVVLAGAVHMLSSHQADVAAREAAEQRQHADAAAQRAEAAAILAEQRYFSANRSQILAQVGRLAKEKQFIEANALAARFLKVTKDAQLQAAANAAAKTGLLWKLDNDVSMGELAKADAYTELAKLDPAHPGYRSKARHYQDKAQAIADRAAAEQAAVQRLQARQAMLEKQFSPWDGSHRKVEAAVKRDMKNPSSYEHVETRYTDLGTGMRIHTTFRGTNSFGGVVPNTVIAIVDDDGDVLSMNML